MNLSSETLSVLKNFSAINSNVVIRPGQTLKTMSEAKNIMASATVAESFPDEFGIYDLNEFLSVVSMFDNPTLDFDSNMKFVSIVDGKRSVKYFFSDTSILTTPTKDITMPPCELKFNLSADDLSALRKAASALGVSDVVVSERKATVTDVKDNTSNSFSIDLDVTENPSDSYSFVFNINNFKLLTGDYEVAVSSKLISHFKNQGVEVEYYIALEKSSTFDN